MHASKHPAVLLISLIAMIGFACQTLTSESAPSAPTPTLPIIPTSRSTDTPAPTVPPTNKPPAATATETNQEFFTEEFEDKRFIERWYYFVMGPGADNDENLVIEQSGDGVNFDLGALDFYLYYIYDPKEYEDVKITMVAENLGRNNNNVSMICRFDFDNAKWYEFSVESGGVWFLYAYDNGYNTLDSGGAATLNQGKAINEYSMECNGDTISVYINGQKLKSFPDRIYNFRKGEVGFNISSLNVLPVTVNVKSFEIAKP